MTKGIMVDHTTGTITLTKVFAKKSETYGTPEYKDLLDVLSAPRTSTYKVVIRTIKKNPNKETFRNLTYKNMEDFIKSTDDPDAYMKEFEMIKMRSKVQRSSYKFVVNWFTTTFPNYKEAEVFSEKGETSLLSSKSMPESNVMAA